MVDVTVTYDRLYAKTIGNGNDLVPRRGYVLAFYQNYFKCLVWPFRLKAVPKAVPIIDLMRHDF